MAPPNKPKRWVLIPDKFRGSISATEVCEALGEGILSAKAEIDLIKIPLADGGEGSLDVLGGYKKLLFKSMQTVDPLGRPIEVSFGIYQNEVFIESAKVIGLQFLSDTEKNPQKTSSYGLGLVIRQAINDGYAMFHIFLGGSGTNDGGIGLLMALGYDFLDKNQKVIQDPIQNWYRIEDISAPSYIDSSITFYVYADVKNPIIGAQGATYVFGPQKGAKPDALPILENRMMHLVKLYEKHTKLENLSILKSGGAAGGLGLALHALLKGTLCSGTEFFLEISQAESKIIGADLVISGEGKLDSQSVDGKLVGGIAEMCAKHGVPLILVVGQNAADSEALQQLSVQEVISIAEWTSNTSLAISQAYEFLKDIGFRLAEKTHIDSRCNR